MHQSVILFLNIKFEKIKNLLKEINQWLTNQWKKSWQVLINILFQKIIKKLISLAFNLKSRV